MSSLKVLTPKRNSELAEALNTVTPKSKILGGGTDLVILLHKGKIDPDFIIDITANEDLNYIKEENGYIYIGATTTITQILESELITDKARCLSKACEKFASTQIRNKATIGGNIANASPAGDTLPALMVLDAEVSIINSKAEVRTLPLSNVLVGPGKNALNIDEVIIGVKFPVNSKPRKSTYVKLGTRTAVTISKISLAVNINYDESTNTIYDAKIALGAVGNTTFRATKIESQLKGKEVSVALKEKFSEKLSEVIQESIPTRASLPYKRRAIIGVAYQAFEDLFAL
jgi:CO/xanthine dehydrogenase FAD-binding subunit